MRNIWTIAKREYDNYFNSPLAYVVAFAILLPMGIYFSLVMFVSSQQALQGGPAPDSSPMIFLSPALTMRLLSDEARMGTLELLLTAPIRDFELVAGKWLGAFLFVLSIAALTLVFPLIINNYVSPGIDWMVVLSSYLGMLLVCAALLALGTGISAIFTNQFAAFFTTLGLFFFLGDIIYYLSLTALGLFAGTTAVEARRWR